jgi:hypothetical protein
MYVHTRGYEATPAPAESGQCPRCRGLGQSPGGPQTDPGPCEECAATGRVVYAERRPEHRQVKDRAPYFVVTQGPDVVDVGMDLERLAAELVAAFPALDGDLAVWQQPDSLCAAPRLVAVVYPSPKGTAVRYL